MIKFLTLDISSELGGSFTYVLYNILRGIYICWDPTTKGIKSTEKNLKKFFKTLPTIVG